MDKAADFVFEKTTGTGTGAFALDPVEGFARFGDSFPDNDDENLFFYCIRHRTKDERETGEGYLDTNGDLVRVTVLASTNSDEKVNFTSGLKDVVCDVPAVIQSNYFTAAEKSKLAGIEAGAQVNAVTSVAGRTGAIVLTKTDVGLSNVDNTSDANKPVSTATQTALDLKANLASPTFTGTVGGITKSMVGLGNADNTSDANKPVSTATQTALDLKSNITSSINTQEDNYTLVLADADKIVEMDKATAVTLTIPPNASVPFPIGTKIAITQYGAGQVTVVAGAGVTIRTAETLLLEKQYAGASIYKRATDEWVIFGKMEAA